MIELCQFPKERCSSTVIVTSEDYRSLEEGEYVNDTIVDFYLSYLHNQVLNMEDRDNVYVFSSHFYSKLSSSPLRKQGVWGEPVRGAQEVFEGRALDQEC